MSYLSSSYILDCIFQVTTEENESENTVVRTDKKVGYHQVPPSMMENYCHRKFERVEKALNIKLKSVSNEVNQLPDDINVTYTKSDVCESASVNDVVEKVFDGEKQNDFTKNENSESKFEDEESFTIII
ncbi:hypothetical protein HanIR_Chr01g0028201 [Helianthus annuus]|nr:hypothetical protein HanIR_Chr01g0028201 [Helianthus annuus]